MSHWTARAACAGLDTELFFSDNPDDTRAAKDICAGCPVVWACLDEAKATDQSKAYGVRAGLTGYERQQNRMPRKPAQRTVAHKPAKTQQDERRANAQALFDLGLSANEVAKHIGVDKTTARRWRAAFRQAA